MKLKFENEYELTLPLRDIILPPSKIDLVSASVDNIFLTIAE